MEHTHEAIQSQKVADIITNLFLKYIVPFLLAIIGLYIGYKCARKMSRQLVSLFGRVTGRDVESQLFPEVHIPIKID